jgi:signal transduction histidine kinase
MSWQSDAPPQGTREILPPLPDRQAAGLTPVSAAGVVHDLGNLIQVATSAVTIVARSPSMPPERSGPILARATSSLEEAGALVRQTIGLIRGRAIVAEDVSVTAALDEVRTLIGLDGETSLVLQMDVEDDLPQVRCDPVGLRGAILNLVFNARDAMAGTGVVRISARAICGRDTSSWVEIDVSDSGVGMTPATIARAFDPFFTTKSDGLGGVGLPMVERFVRDTGGDIAIESKRGTGTRVILRLPSALRSAHPVARTEDNR